MIGKKVVYASQGYSDKEECEGIVLDKIIVEEEVTERVSHDHSKTSIKKLTKYLVKQSVPYSAIVTVDWRRIRDVI